MELAGATPGGGGGGGAFLALDATDDTRVGSGLECSTSCFLWNFLGIGGSKPTNGPPCLAI